MGKKRDILELRQRLDTTLALPDLANEDSLKSLVKDQLVRSSFSANEGDLENVVSRRTKEVSNFLEMLRSASENEKGEFKAHGASQSDWKIKQDADQFRVLYREGSHGVPFHTFLTEGCADGSIDVCLCVSWESILYKKWWPQYNMPTFKITLSTCLKKVRIGEEISLVRIKVPWPVSDREALLHYFEIEYFKEDLILVLINTISDMEHIDIRTHGFTRDGIPEAKDTVRIDLVGGFVLQKVNANRSYFRAILNMDMKLDFVPPSLINFMSRQLVGSGYKLYQKAVGSVATSDDDYREALKGQMYVRIREGLDPRRKHETKLESLKEEKHTDDLEEFTVETAVENPPTTCNTSVTEIEEEAEHSPRPEGNPSENASPTSAITEGNPSMSRSFTRAITDQMNGIIKKPVISPEVERAVGILDRAIALVRGGNFYRIPRDSPSVNQEIPPLESAAETGLLSDKAPPINNDMDKPFDENEGLSPAEGFRCDSVGSTIGEDYFDAESPKVRFSASKNTREVIYSSSSHNKLIGAIAEPVLPATSDNMKVCDESIKVNSSHENGLYSDTSKPNRKKKQKFCCLNLSLIRGRGHR